MEYSNSLFGKAIRYHSSKNLSEWRRKVKEYQAKRRREVQEFSQEVCEGEGPAGYWRSIAGGLIFLSMIGCVKTVYLPEDAAVYYQKWQYCTKHYERCQKDLEECKELGIDLLPCP